MSNAPHRNTVPHLDATPKKGPKTAPYGKGATAHAPTGPPDSAPALEASYGGDDHGNRFFGGICLALPFSALLWVLGYFLLQHLLWA